MSYSENQNETRREEPAAEEESTRTEHSRHGEHHHHHRRRRHRRHKSSHRFSRKRRSSGKSRKKLTKKQKIIRIILLCAVVLVLVVVPLLLQAQINSLPLREKDPKEPGVYEQSQTVSLEVPFYTRDVSLTGAAVKTLMQADIQADTQQLLEPFREEAGRLDQGLPVKLSFAVKGTPADCFITGSTVEVSENRELTEPRIFRLKPSQSEVLVYHLKTGTTYYYRITLSFSNETSTAVTGTFRTASGPRILGIDGIVNVRDIGGWVTKDGRTVRQGLLYRGSELDGAVEPEFSLSDKGLQDMLTVLDIRTDMDLRGAEENKTGIDALGETVNHIYYGTPTYSEIFSGWGRRSVGEVFSDLADRDNYPVYLHCTYGKDRTGTICYLLEALLGMNEEDMMRDYHLSGLYYGTLQSKEMNDFTAALRVLDGFTMQEKVEGYLRSAGVTEAEMDAIREIFLENG